MIKTPFRWHLMALILVIMSGCKIWSTKSSGLPLSKNTPTLITENSGETWDSYYYKDDKNEYLLYTVINKDGSAQLKFSIIEKFNPLLFSESKDVLPKPKYKQRHISSVIQIDKQFWVYYVEGDSMKDFAKNFRAQIKNGQLINIEQVKIDKPLRVIHWQKFRSLPNNSVILAFRDGKGMGFGTSEDGINFTKLSKTYKKRGAKPNIVALSNEKLIYAFQVPGERKGTMMSHISTSTDAGKTWNEKIKVTESHDNVHDTYLFKRTDGLVDMYYIYPIANWRGFSLFRRCIKSDFSFGKEQQVIEKEIGHLMKPYVYEINNNKRLVTFIEANSNYNPFATIIYGDADCI